MIPPRVPSPILSCASSQPAESLQGVLALQALSLEGLAEQYLRSSLAARPDQPQARLFLSKLEAKQGNASAALFDAGKIVPDYTFYEFSELPKEMWNLLFPQNYWALVERQARANRIDPYLVMGLIRQESAFSPRATSSANARGLMQVEPTTATSSNRPARVRSTGTRLYNPTYNIRFGCSYLRTLLKDFDNKPELALGGLQRLATTASGIGPRAMPSGIPRSSSRPSPFAPRASMSRRCCATPLFIANC